MSEPEKNQPRRRWPLILLAILVPLIPSVWTRFLQEKERAPDPPENILEEDARALLESLPPARGEALPFSFVPSVATGITVRSTFRVLKADELPDANHVPDAELESEIKRRGGVFRFDVAAPEGGDGARRVRVARLEGEPLAEESIRPLEFDWFPDGRMTWVAPRKGDGPTEFFLRHWGVLLPGVAASPLRLNEPAIDNPEVNTFQSERIMEKLQVALSEKASAQRGGLYLVERPSQETRGSWRFQWIGYRRHAASGRRWGGSFGSFISGELSSPTDAPFALSGAWRTRERFELESGDAEKAWADHVIEVTQESTLK